MDEYNQKFVEVQAAYEALPFDKKLEFANATRKLGESHVASKIKWDGYLMKDEWGSIKIGDGDYYVYMWKHAWGEPFYVGSGKGGRWTTKAPRNPRFYNHLDNGDAVVYKIVSGMDKSTSLAYEEYISVMLSSAGIELSNGDNNVYGKGKAAKDRHIKKFRTLPKEKEVQEALINLILKNEPRADGHATTAFLEEYGNSYFSNYYHFRH